MLLDADLAALYSLCTRRLNEQMQRNGDRLPQDFIFELTGDEYANLRSQFATSSLIADHNEPMSQMLDTVEAQSLRLQFATLDAADKDAKPGRGRYSKYLPMAFTESGAIMAAALLNSARATEISVHVVRAFVQWRSMLATNRELSSKLHACFMRPIWR